MGQISVNFGDLSFTLVSTGFTLAISRHEHFVDSKGFSIHSFQSYCAKGESGKSIARK